MFDQAKLAATPSASLGNSTIIVLGLPSSSASKQNRCCLSSVPRKKRKIQTDSDDGGLKHSQPRRNQESDEHELYVRSQKGASPCLEKKKTAKGKNVLQKQGNEQEGQRFLQKCSNVLSSHCIHTEIQVPGEISLPYQIGPTCTSENTPTFFQKVVSPYFQNKVDTGSAKVVDRNEKELTKKMNMKDKKSKENNQHRQKRDQECLIGEKGAADVHLEANRIVSPYFRSKPASDDVSLEQLKEKVKKGMKRNNLKVMEGDEPLGGKRSKERNKNRKKRDKECLIVESGDPDLHLEADRTVSPYFQEKVVSDDVSIELRSEKVKMERLRKKSKRIGDDEPLSDTRCKEKKNLRLKRDEDCVIVENGDADVQLEAHRTVSPYFQAKMERDDASLERQNERAKKGKTSKRMEDDEPLGDMDEMHGCGSNSDKASTCIKIKNKGPKIRESTSKKFKDEAISATLCNSKTMIIAGHQGDFKKTPEDKIHGASVSSTNNMESLSNESEHLEHDPQLEAEISANTGSMVRVKCSKRKTKKNRKENVVSGSAYLFVSGESKVLKESHRRDTSSARVPRYFQEAVHNTHDNEEKTIPNICRKIKGKTKSIGLEELFAKFAYKGGVNITCKDNLKKETTCGSAVKQKKSLYGACTNLTASEKKSAAYQRRSPDNTWKPPVSPYNLLQEQYFHDPWRVLVICMLLNKTTGSQVRRVIKIFFSMFPDAQTAIRTEIFEIARVIQSLGLQHKRAAMIQRFSQEYLSDEWTHVTQLHGIGKYAADAYAIFCTGMWDQVKPNDHMLNHYLKYLKNGGPKILNYA